MLGEIRVGSGEKAVEDAIRSVAPVGQSDEYVSKILTMVGPTFGGHSAKVY